MGRNYYCDYCDRSFKDTPDTRKKHLASLQHANNRMNHYKHYKDPETILSEETGKIPCKRFMSNECMFGESCRFSHYSPQMLMELRQLVAMKQQADQMHYMPEPSEIIQEFSQGLIFTEKTSENDNPQWNYPPELFNYPNLTPSLWPITTKSIINTNFARWS